MPKASAINPQALAVMGFINVRKASGMTAHDVVARVRKITGIKQVGHAGTLDPMATGVLPIALNQACRLIRFLEDDKVYLAEVLFGQATSTDDIEGDSIETSTEMPEPASVAQNLKQFIGQVEQYPPLYSAVHVGGRRLYEMARKGELPPEIPKRTVLVHSIEELGWSSPSNLKLRIHCGSGTYIRSIARDLGQSVDCPACLCALERERVGAFSIEDSVTLEQLSETVTQHGLESLNAILKSPLDILPLKRIELSAEQSRRLGLGQRVAYSVPNSGETAPAGMDQAQLNNETWLNGDALMAVCQGRLVAICIPNLISPAPKPVQNSLALEQNCLTPVPNSLAPDPNCLAPVPNSLAPEPNSLAPVPNSLAPEPNSLATESKRAHTIVELKPEVVIANGNATAK